MKSGKKTIGAFLAAVGGLGIILSILLGPPDLGKPWDFLIGVDVGVITGLGAALSISSLLQKGIEIKS
ncbi:MAG: hypothetical protein PVF58_12120 [Candidatus Methanofastidiosia archaeon]|jgi:hypothetical protein